MTMALPGFTDWLRERERLQATGALHIEQDLRRLAKAAPLDEILTGDLDDIVDRHPSVAGKMLHRSRAAQPLRRAGRLYRRFCAEVEA